MKRLQYIFSVLGIGGTITELILIISYLCTWYMIGVITIDYIENAELVGISVSEFVFTISLLLAGSFTLLSVARMVWDYKVFKTDED